TSAATSLQPKTAYILKLSPNLALRNSFGTNPERTGEFYEVDSSQGWIYVAGDWQNESKIGDEDDIASAKAAEILKLDTEFRLLARATVKGAKDLRAHSVSSDDKGNIYMSGSYGPGSVDFIGASDRIAKTKFTSISAPASSRFLARLDSDLAFVWV